MSIALSRRSLLRAAAVVGAGTGPITGSESAQAAGARWPGHQPGRVYLGMSTESRWEEWVARVGPVGCRRLYLPWRLDRPDVERERLRAEHAAGRLPWVSIPSPVTRPSVWREIAAGDWDRALVSRARSWALVEQPFVFTFHHEPDAPQCGTAAEFAEAWLRVYSVMRNSANLSHVAFVPVMSDWLFDPRNPADPAAWLPKPVLRRAAFVGLDPYQNHTGWAYDVRMPWVLDWLARAGFPQLMLGVGETAACNYFAGMRGAQWWQRSWEWVQDNTGHVGVISYFNSLAHNHNAANWLLDESADKLAVYRTSLRSATTCRLA